MIISASRRTDIPAFYSEWFMNRIRAGYCLVPNPFNSRQISAVSLRPADVDVIVFWSKNPAPMEQHLGELDRLGYRYYFLFTLNDYPQDLEPYVPPLSVRLATFRRLSKSLGSSRVVWRYDPIIVSNRTDYTYHLSTFTRMVYELEGATDRIIISLVDFYRKTGRRLAALEAKGYRFTKVYHDDPMLIDLLGSMRQVAEEHGMAIQSCAEEIDLAPAGIAPGACIDAALIKRIWGIDTYKKDPNQRAACCCAISKDIGICDTCLHGCPYCYATRNHAVALANREQHDPSSPVLVGAIKEPIARNDGSHQLPLF